MTLPGDLTEAGVIRKTHGYKGHLRLSVDYDISFLEEKEPVFLLIAGKPVPFFIEELRVLNNEEVILKLEDINDDQAGRKFEKTIVLIPRSRFPEDAGLAEEPPGFLTGYTLHDLESGRVAQVISAIDTGAQILLEVRLTGGKTTMIPYHDDLVDNIDDAEKKLFMRLPEGLM